MTPSHRCPECGATFALPSGLRAHEAARHGTVIENEHSLTDQERVDIEAADSFPASDPPSSTPVQGMGTPARRPREP